MRRSNLHQHQGQAIAATTGHDPISSLGCISVHTANAPHLQHTISTITPRWTLASCELPARLVKTFQAC
jgi:hypothetical protein